MDRFEVADATALPWPDGQIDLIVCSPPYGLGLLYQGGDPPDYVAWLQALQVWLTNIIVFGLAYWELDRGGPVARTQEPRAQLPPADFRFSD